MKIMCRCGRDTRFEPPFDDFHVERVPCSATCQRIRALEQEPREKLSYVFLTGQPIPSKPVGMLGH